MSSIFEGSMSCLIIAMRSSWRWIPLKMDTTAEEMIAMIAIQANQGIDFKISIMGLH